MKKVIRTISGVTPLAVMLKPYKCPGNCIYCPGQEGVPKSYSDKSPVVMRATQCEYDPKRQVEARIKAMKMMGHLADKVELIVMGGTFSAYPEDYQQQFVKGLFDGLNGCDSISLENAQKMNETAKHRAVAMCLETRPDYCKQNHLDNFLKYGATRIEIGVQTLDDSIHKFCKRGQTTQDSIDATQLLKDYGFKTGYHMMLGLPGSDPVKDLETFKEIFTNYRYQPDQIKIYPTFVMKNTELERLYYNGEYTPYTTEQIVDLIVRIKQIVPPYVRIMRVMRDLPADYIVSDCVYSHLRDDIKKELKERGVSCNCIRCREVGHKEHGGTKVDESSIELKRIEYDASKGKEIFLSYEDTKNDILISLLRLRIPYKSPRPEITDSSTIVREMHTYGPQVKIGAPPESYWQHRGYGKKLLQEAERITQEELGMDKVVIISGVGVRKYFIQNGYQYDGPYVSKKI